MKRVWPLCMALIMVLVLCGCNINVAINKGKDNLIVADKGQASGTVSKLNIDWVSGDLTIEYADVDTIQFEESSSKKLKEEDKMRYQEEDGTLSIYFCEEKAKNVPAKNLLIQLPRNCKLDDMQLDAVSTHVILPESFTVDSFSTNTVSGNLEAAGVVSIENFELNTVSGDITLAVDNLKNCSMDSVSGSVKLMFPENLDFTVTMDSLSGKFNSNFDLKINGKTYSHGNGKTIINANTISGNLEILRQ